MNQLKADILKNILLKELEDTEVKMTSFEEDPMQFILKKYVGLKTVLEYLMTPSFEEYVDAIFIVAPKPTTFKVLLHNGQFFFLQFMGKAYQATVAGKNYYLMTIGEKERCMLAIARLLRFGNPLKTKGPEGAEQATRPEGEEGGAGGEAEAEVPEATPEGGETLKETIKEGPTNAPGISSKIKPSDESDIKTSSELQNYIRTLSKDSKNFTGLASDEIAVIHKIIRTILQKSSKGSTGPTLNAVKKIIDDKTKSIKTEPIKEDTITLNTYGDLKKLIKTIKSGNLKKKVLTKAGEVVLDQFLGFIPLASNAKSAYDLIRAATKTPDTSKSDSWLKKLDIDDDTSAIVDDTIENGFITAVAKEIESEPDDKELEQDYSMNTKLANYLKDKHDNHFVAPTNIPESKILESILKKEITKNPELEKSKLVKQTIQKILQDQKSKELGLAGMAKAGRIANLAKITSDQFVELIKSIFGEKTEIAIYKPNEGPNTGNKGSSKFKMYQFAPTNNSVPIEIILAGGANEGEKFEAELFNSTKRFAGESIENITDPLVKQLYEKTNIDPSKIKPEDVQSTGKNNTNRSLDWSGPKNIGEKISDITIKEGNKFNYLSIKDIKGRNFYSGGTIPFIVQDKEGSISYDESKRSSKPQLDRLFKDLGIDPNKIAEGLKQYKKEGESSQYQTAIKKQGDKSQNLEDFKKFLASGYGYGYWYVRKKAKGELFVKFLATEQDAMDMIGNISEVQIKYPGPNTKTTTIKVITDDKSILDTDYIIELRNDDKAIIPISLKMKSTK